MIIKILSGYLKRQNPNRCIKKIKKRLSRRPCSRQSAAKSPHTKAQRVRVCVNTTAPPNHLIEKMKNTNITNTMLKTIYSWNRDKSYYHNLSLHTYPSTTQTHTILKSKILESLNLSLCTHFKQT